MSKILVTYFSASGVTKKVAQNLADALSADLFEIVPAQPYSNADLDWTNRNSRSSVEMEDRNSRPEILNKLNNMQNYDYVFVGFPIWWYREPSIIDTFMEQYNFNGKTVVLFATSGGSGLGDSANNVKHLAPGANVIGGKRFNSNVSVQELRQWANQIVK